MMGLQHDVSWGTKGSDKVEALPSAKSRRDDKSEAAVVEVQAKPQEGSSCVSI